MKYSFNHLNPAYVSIAMRNRSQARIKGEGCGRQSTADIKLSNL